MVRTDQKKKRIVIELSQETRDELMQIKYKYNFSSIDSLLKALITQTKIIKEVLNGSTTNN